MRTLRLLEPWRSRLLWLSLALNLFAIPLIAGPHLWHNRPPGPPSFDAMIDRLARQLNHDDGARFRTAMAVERPAFDAGRTQVEAARHDLAARVVQRPYDVAATKAALDTMQARIHDTGMRFNDAMARAVGDMSPEGRTEVAQFLNRGPR